MGAKGKLHGMASFGAENVGNIYSYDEDIPEEEDKHGPTSYCNSILKSRLLYS